MLVLLGISFALSKLSLSDWFNEVMMCGVKKIGYSMTCLGRRDPTKREMWEPIFMFYWGFAIKYFVPAVLWFILVAVFIKDVTSDTLYGGYGMHWQIAGISVPMLGLLSFIGGLFIWVRDESYDER